MWSAVNVAALYEALFFQRLETGSGWRDCSERKDWRLRGEIEGKE